MGPLRNSIRDILFLIISTLTLIVVLLAAMEMYSDWRRLVNIRLLKDASALSDRLFDATERLSVERDIALSMLRTRDAETVAGLRPRLVEARRSADDALRAGMVAMDHYTFPELAALRKEIGYHLVVIEALRREVDVAAARSTDPRKAELANRWSNEVTALMLETQNLWIGFVGHFTNIDPT